MAKGLGKHLQEVKASAPDLPHVAKPMRYAYVTICPVGKPARTPL